MLTMPDRIEAAPAALPSYHASTSPVSGLAKGVLVLVLFLVYLGTMPFLITLSPVLLYGVYAVISGCALVLIGYHWSTIRDFRGVSPYFGWLLFYSYWGLLVGAPDLPFEEVWKTVLKNVLMVGALVLALSDRDNLRRVCGVFQVGAVLNAALAIMQSSRPDWVVAIALYRDPTATAFNPSRPAGLWSNPDEAAFCLLFALLLSRWARPSLAWLGRGAALTGIFLSASRTGAYILMLIGILWFASRLWNSRLRVGTVSLWLLGLLAASGIIVALSENPTVSEWTMEESWHLQRILDYSEEKERSIGDPKRSEIADEAMNIALEGPWYGHGAFSFQVLPGVPTALRIGTHNIYIAVMGESGIPGLMLYLGVLGWGYLSIRRVGNGDDRRVIRLMWLTYLIIGLAWHNQFTSFSGMIYIALLFHLPVVLGASSTGEEYASISEEHHE